MPYYLSLLMMMICIVDIEFITPATSTSKYDWKFGSHVK